LLKKGLSLDELLAEDDEEEDEDEEDEEDEDETEEDSKAAGVRRRGRVLGEFGPDDDDDDEEEALVDVEREERVDRVEADE
jgi:hypothetical protein